MLSTKIKLQKLVKYGQLRRTYIAEVEDLNQGSLRQAENTPPFTQSPVELERKNLLRSYHAQGLLPEFHTEDLKDLTTSEAEFFIEIAEANRWRTPKRLVEYYQQVEIDTAPATSEQLCKIITLSKDGFLRKMSSEVLLKICRLTARQLIWRGEMNRRQKCI